MTAGAGATRVKFVRAARMPKSNEDAGSFGIPLPGPSDRAGVQDLRAGLRKQLVRVSNKPARFPPSGVWPIELQADMAAALLDYATTRELCKAVASGAAPRPTAVRSRGSKLEVVWFADAVREFVARRHSLRAGGLDE
jgi:hypothetical protein